jgi:predicted metalloprotease with PDZ domain
MHIFSRLRIMMSLADCPIEIGNHLEFSFTASGIPHHVAMYGEGNFDVDKLKYDMAKIVEACTNVFGQNPNKEYWFIIHNTTIWWWWT